MPGHYWDIYPSSDIDKAPFLLEEDPESGDGINKTGAWGSAEGIVFLRSQGSTDTVPANRDILRVLTSFGSGDRNENGPAGFRILANGMHYFRAGGSQSVYFGPYNNFRGAQHALVLTGTPTPTSNPSNAGMSLDLAVCSVRAPHNWEPVPCDKSGTQRLDRWGGNSTLWRWEGRQQEVTIPQGSTFADSGILIPGACQVFFLGYRVNAARNTNNANQASLGVPSDPERFEAMGGIVTSSIASGRMFPHPGGVVSYPVNEVVRVTADGAIQSGAFKIGIYVAYVRLLSQAVPNFGSNWSS